MASLTRQCRKSFGIGMHSTSWTWNVLGRWSGTYFARGSGSSDSSWQTFLCLHSMLKVLLRNCFGVPPKVHHVPPSSQAPTVRVPTGRIRRVANRHQVLPPTPAGQAQTGRRVAMRLTLTRHHGALRWCQPHRSSSVSLAVVVVTKRASSELDGHFHHQLHG